MNVIDFNNTTHEIRVIPRYDVVGVNYAEPVIYNEQTRQQLTVDSYTLTYTNSNKWSILLTVTLTTDPIKENTSYNLKITDTDGLVHYRGKLFATDQITQKYKING